MYMLVLCNIYIQTIVYILWNLVSLGTFHIPVEVLAGEKISLNALPHSTVLEHRLENDLAVTVTQSVLVSLMVLP